MGEVVCTLAEGEHVSGVTVMEGMIYILRDKERDQVEVYDVNTYRLKRRLTVPNARRFADITSCDHYQYAYMSDPIGKCVHRLDLRGNVKMWRVNDVPACLSVNIVRNLLVTCRDVLKIKEFSSSGYYLRDIPLHDSVLNPRHALEVCSGGFVVCHGSRRQSDSSPVHRVCKVSADGRQVVHSHGGHWGSDADRYNGPHHLAVDDNEFVYVVDVFNRRVMRLSPTMDFARQLVVSRKSTCWPSRLCLDVERQRLYVTENELREGDSTAVGRVLVFSVTM